MIYYDNVGKASSSVLPHALYIMGRMLPPKADVHHAHAVNFVDKRIALIKVNWRDYLLYWRKIVHSVAMAEARLRYPPGWAQRSLLIHVKSACHPLEHLLYSEFLLEEEITSKQRVACSRCRALLCGTRLPVQVRALAHVSPFPPWNLLYNQPPSSIFVQVALFASTLN